MVNLMLSVMVAFAEFERSLLRDRQREGIAQAQAKKRGGLPGAKEDVLGRPGDRHVRASGGRRVEGTGCPGSRGEPGNAVSVFIG